MHSYHIELALERSRVKTWTRSLEIGQTVMQPLISRDLMLNSSELRGQCIASKF